MSDTLDQTITKPPKPRLALNVGFAGHRPNKEKANKYPPDPSALEKELKKTLDYIQNTFTSVSKKPDIAECHDLSHPPALRLLTSLAEGADRLAARCALDLGYQL